MQSWLWHTTALITSIKVLSPSFSTVKLLWLISTLWGDFFFFSGLHPQHMEVPRLGVELELWPLAFATATQNPSHICDLFHSSRQHRILNPPSEARDRTHILMDASQVCYCWATMGTPVFFGEMSIYVFCPFFSWVVWAFLCWVVPVICVFQELSPCLLHHLQIYSPIS